jgi:hypothetical protein
VEQDIESTTGASVIDRRDFIRKSAIVGGMVWAAPAMSTLGSRAFADAGTLIIEEECDNFINFKIEEVCYNAAGEKVQCNDDTVDKAQWEFVSCSLGEGECPPVGYTDSGDCVAGPGTQLVNGVESDDGRIRLTVDGKSYVLWVAEGCEILEGGAAGGPKFSEDRCDYFVPNGTNQTWENTGNYALSNIIGYICCDSPF